MSKIICDVCGTSFPEESSQCPVCGCIPLADAQRVADEVTTENENSGYTQVRGGRYAQNNVRKRERTSGTRPFTREDKPDKILLITAAILLLVIIVAVIYIAVEIFSPSAPAPTTPTTEPSSPTVTRVDCTGLSLSVNNIAFEQKNVTKTLSVTATPANTDDVITFRSENTAIATVSATGVVTAVGEGTTKIIITCGKIVKECIVICDFPQLSLNREEFTLSAKGEKWTLYNGDVPLVNVRCRSDNENVAIFKDGVVEAVGGGWTTVYAEFGDQIVSCKVICSFSNSGVGGNGGVTPDTSTYKIYTSVGFPYFFDENEKLYDVSFNVGDSLRFYLRDEAGNQVDTSLLTWEVNTDAVTIDGNKVTGIKVEDKAYISTTYQGEIYKCILRVNAKQ